MALLGSGGNCHVYEVSDRSLNRTVAVKTLKDNREQHQSVLKRFIREAEVIAQLEHPGVLPIYDLRRADSGQVVFSKRKVKGVSLGDALRHTQSDHHTRLQSISAKVNLIARVCDTFAFAHQQKIIHQDIKPDNIMLGDYGEVLVVDWGTASLSTADSKTGTQLCGTPAYMSPEQANKQPVDERTDIYSTAATLFNMLFGRYVSSADSIEVFWEKKRAGELDWLTEEEASHVPKQLMAILKKALASHLPHRYDCIEAFRDDLRNFLEGQAISAYRDNGLERALRWYRANKIVANLSFLLLLCAGAIFMTSVREVIEHRATWGDPIATETFDNDDYTTRWLPFKGTFERDINPISDVWVNWRLSVLNSSAK